MQDAEEAQPAKRWLVTLVVVALAQALGTGGITLFCPFLPLYIQTLRDARFVSPDLLAGLVIAAGFGLRAVFALVALYYLAMLVIGAQFLPAPKRKRLRLIPMLSR